MSDVSPGYDTRGVAEKYEYLGKNETKIEIVLTCWSVAQAGLNDEKNGGLKSRWTVPLRSVKSCKGWKFDHLFFDHIDSFFVIERLIRSWKRLNHSC